MSNTILHIYSFVICLLLTSWVGQNIVVAQPDKRFEHITVDNVFGVSEIYDITSDSDDFIWIATSKGLVRFDGFTYELFRNQNDNPKSISSNDVRCLLVDKKSNLWIGSLNGLNKYNRLTREFEHYQLTIEDTKNPVNRFRDIIEDEDGTIWIASEGDGLLNFNPNTGKFVVHSREIIDSINTKNARTLAIDREGIIWLGTNGEGLYRYNKNKDQFSQPFINEANVKENLANKAVINLYADKFDTLWIGMIDNGLAALDLKTGSLNFYQYSLKCDNCLSDNDVISINEDNAGNLWLGTWGGGLNIFNRTTHRFSVYKHSDFIPTSIGEDIIYCTYFDKNNITWIGTFGSGLDKYNPQKERFKSIRYVPNNPNSLNSSKVRCVYEDSKGLIWIGTYSGGLNCYDPKQDKFLYYLNSNINSIKNGAMVQAIFEDSEGLIWFGTSGDGLFSLNQKTKQLTQYTKNPTNTNSVSDNDIMAILQDKQGFLWIATFKEGLCKFNKKNKQFIRYKASAEDKNSLNSNILTALLLDSEQKLWISHENMGLNMLDLETMRMESFVHNPADSTSISSNSIGYFTNTPSGQLILATEVGFDVFDKKTKRFTRYNSTNGLGDFQIDGLLAQNDSIFWLGTNNGLFKFIPHLKLADCLQQYTQTDGLQGNDYNQGSCFKNKEGIMYFGGNGGVSYFRPSDIKNSQQVPEAFITKLKVFNQVIEPNKKYEGRLLLQTDLRYTESIVLAYSDKVLAFEFTALEYTNPYKIKFAYKLDGFDMGWNYTDARNRSIIYTNIPPGEYVFCVKATNSDGIWNEKYATLKITITPPFWQTWWFYSLLALIAIALVIAIIVIREKNLRKEKHILEKEVALRTAEIRKLIENLELKNDELNETNQLLEEQKEEINQYNEELKVTNNKLEWQNKRLESGVSILTKQKEKLEIAMQRLAEAQYQLVQSEKLVALGVLTAGIAHEINNPINFISSGMAALEDILPNLLQVLEQYDKISIDNIDMKLQQINALKADIDFDILIAMTSKVIDNIKLGIGRTVEIIRSLQLFTRSDSNEYLLTNINENINYALIMLHNEYKYRITIEKNFGVIPDIYCVPGRINQVFVNLINNAIQAIDNIGTIKISTSFQLNEVCIKIKDSGMGIPNNIIQKIFDPFFTTKPVGKGTGLGLSITYGIIQQHNGRIEVESNELNGTEFSIYLPAQPPQPDL